MRPLRLELEGFTAFRDPVEIDFDDADLFALVGPTGAGKSSIVDAMCFALYGSVPRYDDRRVVAPVISQGRLETRVRFTFAVGDTAYDAVRVVRRSGAGASTKEARLERRSDGEVLAGDADGVTAAVERLLGLDFGQFTTCVVLPQGDFARFLHDKPRDRQALLVDLLDLGVYERMGRSARERAADARTRVEVADERLTALAGATPEARQQAVARREQLEKLKDRLATEQPELDSLAAAAADARATASEADARARLLRALRAPADATALAEAVQAAAARREAAEAQERATAETVGAAEAALAALPARAELERLADAHERHEAVAARVAKGEAALAQHVEAEARAASAAEEAAARCRAGREALDATRLAHRAHELVATLEVGEPCPVCRQAVPAVPDVAVPPGLPAAERHLADAERHADTATTAHRQAELARARVEEKLAAVRAELADLADRLAAAPAPEAVVARLAAVAEAEAALAEARAGHRRARSERVDAQRALDAAATEAAEGWHVFDQARDAIAALGPPAPGRTDLADDWAALVAWAAGRAPTDVAEAEAARRRAEEAEAAHRRICDEQVAACAELGVVLAGRAPAEACVDALARADGEVTRLERSLEEADRLREERAELESRAVVAEALGRHLAARGFEKWLLDEALEVLVQGATRLLLELSDGQYSLALDAKTGNFVVVDHRNADERRPARTLSGGETFLASLALALALADRVGELAARGSARLDAIFLDEGFGSLDADTLDVVAGAIEELGASGRVVGLISHVPELAERVPVRFEVTKGPHTSTVERVSA